MDYIKKNGLIRPKEILFAPMLSTFGGGSIRGFNPGGGAGLAIGEYLYTTTGNHSFTVPAGVDRISVLVIGGGGASHLSGSAGGSSPRNSNSGGGALAYRNAIGVSTNSTINLTVGIGGVNDDQAGGTSSITVSGTTTQANGGSPGSFDSDGPGGNLGGSYDGGGNGGTGGYGNDSIGGGGAGGYSGNGGGKNGSASGGAGGGGGADGTVAAGGGGVGVYGEGSSGSNGSGTTGGGGGSGGDPGDNAIASDQGGDGGLYGGGAGGDDQANKITKQGGQGVVRILYYNSSDIDRSFPSTNVDLASSQGNQVIV